MLNLNYEVVYEKESLMVVKNVMKKQLFLEKAIFFRKEIIDNVSYNVFEKIFALKSSCKSWVSYTDHLDIGFLKVNEVNFFYELLLSINQFRNYEFYDQTECLLSLSKTARVIQMLTIDEYDNYRGRILNSLRNIIFSMEYHK